MGRFVGCSLPGYERYPFHRANLREVVHVDDLFLQNDPAREKILLSEAVLGNVQIRSSAVEISNFKSSPIFLQIPVCVVFAHLVIHFRLNFRV